MQNPVIVGYTKPRVFAKPGTPPFKTQKILGSRAIVSDSFSLNFDDSDIGYGGWRDPYPGKGWYGHRDGYNVLYGDWSARWYGDPQQRLMYWPYWYTVANTASNTKWSRTSAQSLAVNCLVDMFYTDPVAGWLEAPQVVGGGCWAGAGSQSAWHMLDMAHGIDTEGWDSMYGNAYPVP